MKLTFLTTLITLAAFALADVDMFGRILVCIAGSAVAAPGFGVLLPRFGLMTAAAHPVGSVAFCASFGFVAAEIFGGFFGGTVGARDPEGALGGLRHHALSL